MDHKKIQKIVDNVFTEAFVNTPLNKRLEDISKECRELCNYTDLRNLKQEAGDLLASLIQLCNESGWDLEELILNNKEKIERRMLQYKGRGRKTQVAIIGGAFNCITNGHYELAKLVLNASGWADEVWFCPAYSHLDGKAMIEPHHRMQMIELAIENDGRMKMFDYEIKNKLHGETYFFLNKLIHDKEYENYRFAFVIGADRANTIQKWYNFDGLLKLDIPFVVVSRKGFELDKNITWFLKSPHIYISEETSGLKVSSTMVREIIKNSHDGNLKKELKGLLDDKVVDYIIENKLYKISSSKQ